MRLILLVGLILVGESIQYPVRYTDGTREALAVLAFYAFGLDMIAILRRQA